MAVRQIVLEIIGAFFRVLLVGAVVLAILGGLTILVGGIAGNKEEKQEKLIEQRIEREEQLREKLERSGGVTCDGVELAETGDCIPPGEDYWMECLAPSRAAVVANKCIYGGGGS